MMPISTVCLTGTDLNPGSLSNLAKVPINRLLAANAQAWWQVWSTARSPENRLSYSLDESKTWWQIMAQLKSVINQWVRVCWSFALLNRSLFRAWDSVVLLTACQISTRMLHLQLHLGGSFRFIMSIWAATFSHFQLLPWHCLGRHPVLPAHTHLFQALS